MEWERGKGLCAWASQLDGFSCVLMYYNGALNNIECEYSEISKNNWISLDQSILCNVKIKVCVRASVP